MHNPNERQTVAFHVVIRLVQPLSQLSETIGNQTNLRSVKVIDLEGNTAEVFALSGNSLRNRVIRRCGIDSFLSYMGVQVSPIMHHTLFCGGALDGGTGSDMDLDRKIRQFMPCLSVLGTAKPKGVLGGSDAQMIPGRICVGDAYLVCYETAETIYHQFSPALPIEVIEPLEQIWQVRQHNRLHRVNQWLGLDSAPMADEKTVLAEWVPFLVDRLKYGTEWLVYLHRVRNDSAHDPNLKAHLSDTPQLSAESGKKRGSQQMIIGDWLIQPGATLYSYWSGNISRVEEGFIVSALLKFAEAPYLGGQNGAGRGLCTIEIYHKAGEERGAFLHITPYAQTLGNRAQESHEHYRAYLNHNQNEIRKLLNG